MVLKLSSLSNFVEWFSWSLVAQIQDMQIQASIVKGLMLKTEKQQ